MTESLKRVSMVLLALAITLGLSGVLTLGMTNNAKAQNEAINTCSDLGYSSNLESNTSGAWGNIDFTQDDGPLVISVNDGYKVELCVKKGSYNNGAGPVVHPDSPFIGPIDDLDVSYPGQSEPSEGFSHYGFKFEMIQGQAEYQLLFEKKWDGDEFDKSNVEVTFINKEGQTAKPGEVITGDDIFPGAKVEELKEEVTGLPENCSVVSNDIQPVYILFEDMIAEPVNLLSLDNDVPTNGEGMTYTETITVTNTVDCEEPRQPVTPEGETETPVTPAGTTTQVTATPTGAVDAGAGADLAASLAGLMASAAVVAAGVFMRKFSVISL